MPWVCLLAELCIRRPGPLPFAGLASLIGLQFFAGHPTSSFHLVILVSLVWGVRVLVTPELRQDRPVPRLLTLGLAMAVGAAFAAVLLLPFFELLNHLIDRKVRVGQFSDSHAPSRYLLGIFLHDWWGRRLAHAARVRRVARGARLLHGRPAAHARGGRPGVAPAG